MDELKQIYQIILSIWQLFKRYGTKKLTDDEWEALIDESNKAVKEWRKRGELLERLYRDMFMAVSNYYERKGTKQLTLFDAGMERR